MRNAILALLVALGLAATFIGYASVAQAGSDANGSYADEQSNRTIP